jgi:hypothetical protein
MRVNVAEERPCGGGRRETAAAGPPASFDTTTQLNLHAFSYNGTSPGISQRTVNEAAAIVAYVNGTR